MFECVTNVSQWNEKGLPKLGTIWAGIRRTSLTFQGLGGWV
jgi:hypothetical protein